MGRLQMVQQTILFGSLSSVTDESLRVVCDFLLLLRVDFFELSLVRAVRLDIWGVAVGRFVCCELTVN
jgi:hypothetical protein